MTDMSFIQHFATSVRCYHIVNGTGIANAACTRDDLINGLCVRYSCNDFDQHTSSDNN